MNRALKTLTVILLTLSVFAGSLTGPIVKISKASSTYIGYVTVDTLTMRTGPSTTYKSVRYLHRNNKVTVYGKSGSWYKIKYGSAKGYISGKYIKKGNPPKPKPKFQSYGGYVTASSLNLYKGSGTKNKRIKSLRKNSRVTVYGKSSSWLKVKYGNTTGYVSGKYIKKGSPPKPKPRFQSYGGYVTASSLNVRQGPSTKNRSIRSLRKNSKVTVYGKSGSWFKVKYGSTTGYVSGKYIKKGNPPKPIVKAKPIIKTKPIVKAKPIVTPKPKVQAVSYTVQPVNTYHAYIGYDNLKIYKEPNTKSSVVKTLREQTKVNVTGQSGNWKRIQYGSTVGYVNKDNLQSNLSHFNPPIGSAGQFGIDVSHHQGNVDFNAVKQSGNHFVILKASEGITFKDDHFVSYAIAAKNAGLSVHAYHFFRAKTTADAKKEADNFAAAVNQARQRGVTIQYLYIDVETSNDIPTAQLKSTLTNNVIVFLSQLRTKYHDNNLGIYSNQTYFNSYLDLSKIKNAQKGQPRFLIWLSRYRGENTYLGPEFSADVWQFTSNGSVSGVSGAVDRNISYYNPISY